MAKRCGVESHGNVGSRIAGVKGDVVPVASGAEKRAAVPSSMSDLEAEDARIERERAIEVADAQSDAADFDTRVERLHGSSSLIRAHVEGERSKLGSAGRHEMVAFLHSVDLWREG